MRRLPKSNHQGLRFYTFFPSKTLPPTLRRDGLGVVDNADRILRFLRPLAYLAVCFFINIRLFPGGGMGRE